MLVNNPLLFNHEKSIHDSLQSEEFMNVMTDKWRSDGGSSGVEQGTNSAGKSFWDTAPLGPDSQKMRETLYALRQPYMDKCDELGSFAIATGYPERQRKFLANVRSRLPHTRN